MRGDHFSIFSLETILSCSMNDDGTPRRGRRFFRAESLDPFHSPFFTVRGVENTPLPKKLVVSFGPWRTPISLGKEEEEEREKKSAYFLKKKEADAGGVSEVFLSFGRKIIKCGGFQGEMGRREVEVWGMMVFVAFSFFFFLTGLSIRESVWDSPRHQVFFAEWEDRRGNRIQRDLGAKTTARFLLSCCYCFCLRGFPLVLFLSCQDLRDERKDKTILPQVVPNGNLPKKS